MTAEQKIKYLPAGGIAGFVMSDEQVEQLEAEELQEQYGTTGIAQFSTIGKNMANFGRHGDDTVAHVETGELIVPRALIENNPKLKESIFKHLRELGVEDPERYVVGESNNSLNPTTGLPEFFFKKLFKSVSKMVKSVGKILKKAAPIIIPIALNFIAPGLGAVWSGAIGSGIATLVQGGSIKDAFKSALVGGATGALTAGFSGNSGSFMGNVSADVSMGTTNIGNAFSQGSFAPLQSTTGPSIEGLFDGKSSVNNADMASTSTDGLQQANYLDTVTPKETAFIDMTNPTGEVTYLDANQTPITSSNIDAGTGSSNMYDTLKEYGTNAKKYLFQGGNTDADILQMKNLEYKKVFDATGDKVLARAAFDKAGPGMLAKYGPSLAVAGIAGAAGGMFDTPKEKEEEEIRTGMDVYNENPDTYNVGDLDPIYIPGDSNVETKYPYYRPRNVQTVAQGGQIFPRRVGGIMPNEGIPNQDSVRAMLMPGEFVMTTDAVKGLGGGDMNKGINNMYGVMRNLEQRGRRA
jgi:hypothetical protein